MINSLINGIMDFIIYLIDIILIPLDLLIESLLPDISNVISYISSFFIYIGNLVPWVISYFGLNQEILSLIVLYFTFKLTAPITVRTIKMAVKWYNVLKI